MMPMRRHSAFGHDAAAALLLNRSLHNWAIVAITAGFISLPYVISRVPIMGNMALLVTFLFSMVTAGLFCAYLHEVIPATASGEDELPDYGDFHDAMHSIIEPVVTCLWTVVALLAPWIAWRLALPHVDFGSQNAEAISWLLGLGGLALAPIGFIATAWGGVGMVFRVDVLFRAVLRAPVAYALLLGTLTIVVIVIALVLGARAPERVLPGFLIRLAGGNDPLVLIRGGLRVFEIPVLAETIVVYTLVLLAKLLGLYQRHFGEHMPWTPEHATTSERL